LCTFYLKMVTKSGPKHVVVVHNKIEHEKHLLRTVVLIKVLTPHNPIGLQGLLRDSFTFTLLIGGYTRNRMHNPTIK
jgi:hypothetical protein